MRDFRKHTSWYLSGYPVGPAVRRRSLAWSRRSPSSTTSSARSIGRSRSSTGGERIKRGHTNGPIKVSLPDGYLDARRRRAVDARCTVPDDGHVMALSGG